MSHKMLSPLIVKVSVLGYFPLYIYIYIYIYYNLLIHRSGQLDVFIGKFWSDGVRNGVTSTKSLRSGLCLKFNDKSFHLCGIHASLQEDNVPFLLPFLCRG